MKIYTKHGDQGDTGLFGGPRVRKYNLRIASYGDVDELNAVLGIVRCEPLPQITAESLERIQHELFDLGAELASPKAADERTRHRRRLQTAALENEIDAAETRLEPLKQFVLPAGTRPAALLHQARTVCRRAERAVVQLSDTPGEIVSPEALEYLNRLSDWLFVMARAANASAGSGDVPWRGVE